MNKKVKCIKEARARRAKIAHLEITSFKQQPEEVRDFFPERKHTRDVVVIEVGKKMPNGVWDNSNKLWLTTDEFLMLKDAFDEFRGSKGGDTKPPAYQAPGKRKFNDNERRLIELHEGRKSNPDGEGQSPPSSFSDAFGRRPMTVFEDFEIQLANLVAAYGAMKGGAAQ